MIGAWVNHFDFCFWSENGSSAQVRFKIGSKLKHGQTADGSGEVVGYVHVVRVCEVAITTHHIPIHTPNQVMSCAVVFV
jgi:hypothetical protein